MNNKILIVGPKTNGGITKVISNLFSGGINAENNVHFYASSLGLPQALEHITEILRIFKFLFTIINFNPAIVHIHTSSKGSFYRKSVYSIIAKAFNKKLIIQIHPTHFMDFRNRSNQLLKKYIGYILNLANVVIVLTDKMQSEIKQICSKNMRVTVLKNPITVDEFIPNAEIKRNQNVLLYLGWIIKNKGVYDLLDAVPIVREQIKDFRLIYCGNKEVSRLKRMVKEKGLESIVEVKGWIDGEEKRALLSTSTALILPTYSEGLPNVILEAMASSIPIITTPVGGIPSILSKDENCMYFEPGNIIEMSEKIVELFHDSTKRKKIVDNNNSLIKNYDSKLIVKQLELIYENT